MRACRSGWWACRCGWCAYLLGAAMQLLLIVAPAAVALPAKTAGVEKSKTACITLYGRIDELSYLCSSTGIRLAGGKLPSKVEKISLGSSAAYSGLREGDRVLQAQMDDHSVTLTIDRKGRQYQAKIATDVKGLKAQFEARKIAFSFGDSPFDKELKLLSKCNVVFVLDKSLSMQDNHAGCPGDLSKWTWSRQQIDNFFLATDRVLDNGFDLVLFNDTFEQRRDVTLWDLKQVFGTVRPRGQHKNISQPLEEIFKDYFYKRKHSPDTKPLVVVVLTDGTENVGTPLQEVLIEASQKLTKPGEALVTFMQVGDSISAEELFDDLDQNLVAKGARYHMVNYVPFTTLRNRGLLWELMKTVKEAAASAPKNDSAEAK